MNKQLTRMERIACTRAMELRKKLHYSQRDVASELKRLTGKNITNVQVSQWETKKRAIPYRILPALCQIYNCTEEYMTGESDNPNSILSTNKDYNLIKLDGGLEKYDQMPVYMQFIDHEYENCWGIVDIKKDRIVCAERVFTNISKITSINFYISIPLYDLINFYHDNRIRNISKLLNYPGEVFVRFNSNDAGIREKYSGWFHLNEDKSCLINSLGFVLPLSGMNVSYTVYEY